MLGSRCSLSACPAGAPWAGAAGLWACREEVAAHLARAIWLVLPRSLSHGALGALLVACCITLGRGGDCGNEPVLLPAACGCQGRFSPLGQARHQGSSQLSVFRRVCVDPWTKRALSHPQDGDEGQRCCPCPCGLCCGCRPAPAPAPLPGQHGADARCDPPGFRQVLPPALPAGHTDRLHPDGAGRLLGECGTGGGGVGLAS